jgi:hypothetical protein
MVIHERCRFASNSGNWHLFEDAGTIKGDGPFGFSIAVHDRTIIFTSICRFGSIVRPDAGISEQLRLVFECVAEELGGGTALVVASGGYGDTDHANDLALEGATFEEICRCLESKAGPPARTWEELSTGELEWYLSTFAYSPRIANCAAQNDG